MTALTALTFFAAPQAAFAGDTTDSALDGHVRNFQKLSDGIWRGAEPSEQALVALAESGVKTIIDLRMSPDDAAQESKHAKRLGLRYVHVPLGFIHPPKEKLQGIMRIATNPVNQPVFIHCAQGADRTGTLCALYRRVFQGWNYRNTYREMRAHHFKPWLFTLKSTVRNFKASDFDAESLESAPELRPSGADSAANTFAPTTVASLQNG